MPVYRRRPARPIAKVNATSIDGYFGEGTPCFFIRGTILSDVQVAGEYRTLAIQRPGNTIEIEAYDGDWATVVITTRAGNRAGDNLRARMLLRDADLRSVGLDCERIMAGFAPFETPAEPAPEPPPPPPPPPVAVAAPPPPPVVAPAGFAPWTEATETALNGSNGTANGVAHAHEPVVTAPDPLVAAAAAAATAAAAAAADAAAARAMIERVQAAETARSGSLFGGKTTVNDGKIFIEVGASVVAVGLPVVLFFLRSLFGKKKGS